jgi:hypothetical protein
MKRIARILSAPALVLASLAACGDRKPEPETLPALGAVLPNLVLPARAAVVSRSGSADALSIVLRAPEPPDSVARFYRSVLNPPLWRLVSDGKDQDGAHVLYAEQDGPPLWIRIWADTATNGTFVRLTGALQKLQRDTVAVAGGDSAPPAGTASGR